MSTDEIAKTIQVLKVITIQEALKQSGSKAFQNVPAKASKPELIKLYERQVMDVGIEKFINRINESIVTQTAKLFEVESIKPRLVEKVQEIGIEAFLSKTSFGMPSLFLSLIHSSLHSPSSCVFLACLARMLYSLATPFAPIIPLTLGPVLILWFLLPLLTFFAPLLLFRLLFLPFLLLLAPCLPFFFTPLFPSYSSP